MSNNINFLKRKFIDCVKKSGVKEAQISCNVTYTDIEEWKNEWLFCEDFCRAESGWPDDIQDAADKELMEKIRYVVTELINSHWRYLDKPIKNAPLTASNLLLALRLSEMGKVYGVNAEYKNDDPTAIYVMSKKLSWPITLCFGAELQHYQSSSLRGIYEFLTKKPKYKLVKEYE